MSISPVSGSPSPHARTERRFESRRSVGAHVFAALGSLLLGAGFYDQFLRTSEPFASFALGPCCALTGIVLIAAGYWLETRREPAIRVGDGGIAVERSDLQRIPWYGIDRIAFDTTTPAIQIAGTDEHGAHRMWRVTATQHPRAVGWIGHEAHLRIPKITDLPEAFTIAPPPDAGSILLLDPPQIVGRKCAASGTVIAFEPDARLCPPCGRVYHRDHAPPECVCGAQL